MTAVKAWLEPHTESGPLEASVKTGAGLLLHLQNDAGERPRAKVRIQVQPAEWKGSVKLAAANGKATLWDADKAGNAVNLDHPVKVGPGERAELFLEGKAPSADPHDGAVSLAITDLSKVVDSFNATVVKAWLEVHRTTGAALDPGVMKGDGLLVHAQNPAGEPDGVGKEGVVFWVEGAAMGGPRDTELQLDVEDVDECCDAISYTVADPVIEVTVVRHDSGVLADDVTVHLTPVGKDAPVKTDTIPKGIGKKAITVPAGHYVVTLEPKDVTEAKMRVNRLIPDDARQAAVALLANAPVKLELAPPYTQVQFIAYWQTTGVYKGTDQPCALDPSIPDLHDRAEGFKAKWKTNAMGDIEGRCAIMVEAITQAHARPEVKKSLTTDRHVLKVFMAPEFYFRGQQGVYPFEAVSEILNVKALRDKMLEADFRDWLFVLGSAIGAIEGGGEREKASYEGDVTDVLNGVRLKISCPKASAAAAMTDTWKLAIDTSGGAWTSSKEYDLFSVTTPFVGIANTYLELGVNQIPNFNPTQKMRVSATGSPPWHDVTFADDKMTVFLVTTPKPKTPVPVLGWTIDIGMATAAPIVNITDKGAGSFQIEADVPTNFTPATGKFKVNDPGGQRTEYPNCTVKTFFNRYVVHIQVPKASPEAGVATGWKLHIDTSGAGTFATYNEHNVTGVNNRGAFGPTAADTAFDLIFSTNPTFDANQRLALYDGGTIYTVVGRREPTKIVRLIVTTNGARPAPGWAIEGAVQGAIINVVQLAARDFLVDVGTKLDTVPTIGSTVKLVEPGETEIINIAPVFKGGTETPVGADGRALKELLVYKETISSVDFTTLDYGSSDFFYGDVRHLIQAYADKSTRALPTVGSTDALATSPNNPGTTSSSGYRVSEVSLSGIGGGTVFTMDKITFGLEVCLDQNMGRLEKYYGNPVKAIPSQAKSGEPKVQVQLIPSCGAGINNPCTVTDGPIFNVDVAKHGAKINGSGGLTDINQVEQPFAPPLTNVDTYFETGKNAGAGKLAVYDPAAIAAPAKVP